MNTCGSCKWWGEAETLDLRFHKCEKVRHGVFIWYDDEPRDDPADGTHDNGRYVVNPESDEYVEDDLAGTTPIERVFVEDGQRDYAALFCREDFGCVLWESAA